jgi:predicted phosphate transport protein (TIGR00153 family)
VRFRLVPTDDRFFELFGSAAANVAECARRLSALVSMLPETDGGHAAVMECERRGDQLTREILHRLNSTFVAPFDREDIHALAEELDDVVDDMLSVAALLDLVHPREVLPELAEQAGILVQMGDELVRMMERLQDMNGLEPHLDAIDQLETDGDLVYRRAVARLFDGGLDPIEVVKWKDVIAAMEDALNTIEDVSDVIESIVLKHA